jgi:hypothetical protein
MALTPYRRCFRPAWPGLLFPLLLCAADDPVDKVEKAATEWVRTRAETVRAETEWNGQHGLMESLVNALDERAKLIEEKKEYEKTRTAQEREELDGLESKNIRVAEGLQQTETRLKTLARTLTDLRPLLPPRLSAGLDLAFKSLADDALPVGDRMQHTMTVLGRCAQFNRVISCNEEVLTLEGESAPKSLEVIYWGLSHGYALDRGAGKVWLGSPGPQGWRWTPRPGAAKEVAHLIAMATDKADPDFVIAPATLNQAGR